MASAKECLVQNFRKLDHHGTGTLPRRVFEDVMREVCEAKPAWLESLEFAMARLDGDVVNYNDFFDWVYGGSAGEGERMAEGRGTGCGRPAFRGRRGGRSKKEEGIGG